MSKTVREIMTTRVIWVSRDATFREMAVALREHRISAFPVVDDDHKVIGVVSEADLLTKEALDDEPGVLAGILHRRDQAKARGITAGDLMTATVVAVRPDDTVEHAARLMYDRRVKRLPVTDADGHLAGIVSRADVLSVFSRADTEIREEVEADVALSASPYDRIIVGVRDGIVTLDGTAGASETVREITRRVRHIEGVVAVRDRVACPPPGSGSFDVLARFPVD
jgi:CBS domain-containing protein